MRLYIKVLALTLSHYSPRPKHPYNFLTVSIIGLTLSDHFPSLLGGPASLALSRRFSRPPLLPT